MLSQVFAPSWGNHGGLQPSSRPKTQVNSALTRRLFLD